MPKPADIEALTYLGDGAYVKRGRYPGEVILTTSDGISDTNTIYLEPSAIDTLLQFLHSMRGTYEANEHKVIQT